MNTRLVLITLFILAAAPVLQAKPLDVEYVSEDVTVSPLGDGTIVIKHKFDAQSYLVWQKKYGTNPSLLKRDWNKLLSAYDITDFKVDQNAMDRVATITIAARGCVNSKGNGLNEMEFPKNFKPGERVGNVFPFHCSIPLDTGQVLDTTTRVVLPDAATDLKTRTNEDGNPVIVYRMPAGAIPGAVSASILGLNPWIWIGTGLVIGFFGLISCLIALLIGKKEPAL